MALLTVDFKHISDTMANANDHGQDFQTFFDTSDGNKFYGIVPDGSGGVNKQEYAIASEVDDAGDRKYLSPTFNGFQFTDEAGDAVAASFSYGNVDDFPVIVANDQVVVDQGQGDAKLRVSFDGVEILNTSGTTTSIKENQLTLFTDKVLSANAQRFSLSHKISGPDATATDEYATLGQVVGVSYPYDLITATGTTPTANKINAVDPTAEQIDLTLTYAILDDDWYEFVLIANSNHCNITVNGIVHSLSSVGASIRFKGTGTGSYIVELDTRALGENVPISVDTNLLSGFAHNGTYEGIIDDATTTTVTFANWDPTHIKDKGFFPKTSGANSSYRVKSVDETFDETITDNGTSITVEVGSTGFFLAQDSRIKPQEASVSFFPTTTVSSLYAGWQKAVGSTGDPDYNTTEVEVSLGTVPDTSDTLMATFALDQDYLTNIISARNLLSIPLAKVSTSIGGNGVQLKYKYYGWPYGGDPVADKELLLETQYSEIVNSITDFQQKYVTGVLPTFNWVGYTVVGELYAKRSNTSGTAPILTLLVGGSTPSKSQLALPSSSITHDSTANKQLASEGAGVPYGHLTGDEYAALGNITKYTASTYDQLKAIIEGPITSGLIDIRLLEGIVFPNGGSFTLQQETHIRGADISLPTSFTINGAAPLSIFSEIQTSTSTLTRNVGVMYVRHVGNNLGSALPLVVNGTGELFYERDNTTSLTGAVTQMVWDNTTGDITSVDTFNLTASTNVTIVTQTSRQNANMVTLGRVVDTSAQIATNGGLFTLPTANAPSEIEYGSLLSVAGTGTVYGCSSTTGGVVTVTGRPIPAGSYRLDFKYLRK